MEINEFCRIIQGPTTHNRGKPDNFYLGKLCRVVHKRHPNDTWHLVEIIGCTEKLYPYDENTECHAIANAGPRIWIETYKLEKVELNENEVEKYMKDAKSFAVIYKIREIETRWKVYQNAKCNRS